MAWYEEAQNWINAVGLVVAGGAGWALKTWKGYSAAHVEVKKDTAEGDWYEDQQRRIKELQAGQAAALASAKALMDEKVADARIIGSMQTMNEMLKERAASCEASAVKAEAKVLELEERMRTMSEQLLYTHLRGRAMYAEIMRLDPSVGARVVQEHFEANIKHAAETVLNEQKAITDDNAKG